jgi:hypothetical protein
MVSPVDTHTPAPGAADQTAAATEHSDDTTEAARMAEAAAPPVTAQPRRGGPHWSPLELANEPSAEVRAAQRRAARVRFRAYCIACGRSTESATAAGRPGRCQHCGGTILVESAEG